MISMIDRFVLIRLTSVYLNLSLTLRLIDRLKIHSSNNSVCELWTKQEHRVQMCVRRTKNDDCDEMANNDSEIIITVIIITTLSLSLSYY